MKLVPKQWDEYNPVLGLMGAGFAVVGGYVTLMMPGLGQPIVWLVRGPFAILAAVGSTVLIRQFQLWRKRETSAPRESDRYHPFLVLQGAVITISCSYALLKMGVSGPPVAWLVRGFAVIFFAMGSIILIRQFQLRRRRGTPK